MTENKNYFAFIDESGNLASERYFGIGMLLIEDAGFLYDAIKPFYDKARDIAKAQKEKTITDYLQNGKYNDLAVIAKASRGFELKFKYINFTNNAIYTELLRKYFTFPVCRFSAIVVDRQDEDFKPQEIFANPWSMYLRSYSALLLAGNMNNLDGCNVCVLADDLTKPKFITTTFENALRSKILQKLKQDGCDRSVFNVTRLEFHASLMLQLVDILLGSVLYDFKKTSGLIGEKLKQRQEIVAQTAREAIGRTTLADHFTANKPSYFNVWKMKWKKE
jgi:hypothetical protein